MISQPVVLVRMFHVDQLQFLFMVQLALRQINTSTTSLSATISSGVGTSDLILTSVGKDGGHAKQSPCGGVMCILCCIHVVQRVPQTPCSHCQGLCSWRVEFLEVDGYPNKFGMLEVAMPMGLASQRPGLAQN